jgi:acid-sensing ion channel, other
MSPVLRKSIMAFNSKYNYFSCSSLADDLKYSNNIKLEYWLPETGYSTEDIHVHPKRALGGARAGLNIMLKLTESDFDYICKGSFQGFKINLHTSNEVQTFSKQYFRVPLRQEVVVSVKPKMITTDPALIKYSSEQRQCLFNKEGNLKFFKFYSQKNCELECLANFTLNACGCVKFSMPRDNKTRICTLSQIGCYEKAEDSFMVEKLRQSFLSHKEKAKHVKTKCNCLPSCTSIDYDAEISQADYDFVKNFKSYGGHLEEFPEAVWSRLTVFISESEIITSNRSERFGILNFVVDFGGVLGNFSYKIVILFEFFYKNNYLAGLFMGVSTISLIEVFYYITLRLICNISYRRHQHTKIEKNMPIDFRN